MPKSFYIIGTDVALAGTTQEHITRYKMATGSKDPFSDWPGDGERQVFSKQEGVDFFKERHAAGDNFYSFRFDTKEKQAVELKTVFRHKASDNGGKVTVASEYLRTKPDSTKTDNLYSLPSVDGVK